MSTNLINKNNGYTFGYIDVNVGSLHPEINQNQDFLMNEYFLVKKGEIVEFTSKQKYGVTETSIYNAVYIHVYDMQKQWKFALDEEATELNKDLSLKYEVTEDCYIRFCSRGFYDFEHKAAINIINDTIPRLEKFIYAICSMDVSDLPVPLSRIEKLWNCLITGETPDFEPLSRNEKYLMVMLDRYDISNLPAPMSRGEKLLYKIAVGETDLSDVPGYLSQYEELLKYLIENGGISEGDFEYVLYTLNQSLYTLYTTAEKPVKSAILKGQTLVNLCNFKRTITGNATYSMNEDTITVTTIQEKGWSSLDIFIEQLKANANYILMVDNVSFTHADKFGATVSVYCRNGNEKIGQLSENSKFLKFNTGNYNLSSITIRIHATLSSSGIGTTTVKGIRVLDYQEGMENWDIPYFEGMQSVKMPVLTTTNEDGTKTNILATNEDIELRGIGDVQDELDCLTGEVVERIKERVFNGSEKWIQNGQHSDGSYRHICNTYTDAKSSSEYIICDKIGFANVNHTTGAGMTSDINIVKATSTGKLQIATTKTLNELKDWLAKNPITIQYELATESIKTVDLTVVDQDNQPTQLGTFKNVTHVLLNSEGLIPTAALTVGIKIPSASSTSLLMDDISTKQEQLETTVDEQSENVDATMIATTEIFEEIL